MWLAACLSNPELSRYPDKLLGSFNFGPSLASNRNVAELVQEVLKHWTGEWEDKSDPLAKHEAKLLNLATDKAYHLLQWSPVWSFEKTIDATVSWYRKAQSEKVRELTISQISEYTGDAQRAGLAWARGQTQN